MFALIQLLLGCLRDRGMSDGIGPRPARRPTPAELDDDHGCYGIEAAAGGHGF